VDNKLAQQIYKGQNHFEIKLQLQTLISDQFSVFQFLRGKLRA